jgi:SAM-dependent methyltransferase
MDDHTMTSTPTETRPRVWSVQSRVRHYQALQGWIDGGERAAIASVASEVRSLPLLDLGVGAGRTTSLMRLLTDDYVGVDWSGEMVEACRTDYPGIDIRQGDARDLSEFAPSTFKFVLFSYNGLDNVDHEGRGRVLSEVNRVLRPDGIFGYSTFSMDGNIYGQRPWGRWRRAKDHDGIPESHPLVRRTAKFAINLPSKLPKYPHLYANWERNSRVAEQHENWATAPVASLDFNLAHFSSPEGECSILDEHGLVISDLFDNTGNRIEGAKARCPWFFVVARTKKS